MGLSRKPRVWDAYVLLLRSGGVGLVLRWRWWQVGGAGWTWVAGVLFSGGSVPEAKGQPTGELLRARAQNETS